MRKHVRWVRKRAILRERVGQVCCREGQTISQGWLHIFYRADTGRATAWYWLRERYCMVLS